MAISKGTVLDDTALAWTTVGQSNGDLLVLFFYNDGGDNQTAPGTLTRIGTGNQGTSMEAGCYYRQCTGSETGNVFTDEGDFGISKEGYNAHWFLIPAAEWHGTTVPETADAQAATGTIDPPSLTPSGWDASAEDTIWIIAGGRDDDDGISAVSSGYSTNEQLTENVNQVEVGSSYRVAAVASENPGTFTQTGTAEEFIVFTVAVRPVVAGDVEVIIPLATLTLTGQIPTVVTSDHQTVDVPLATLTLTSYAPTIVESDHQVVDVPLGTLTLTGLVPTVAVTENINIAVPAGSLGLSGYAPTVEVTEHIDIEIPVGSLSLTGYVPTVSVGANVDVEVPAGSLALMGYAPTVEVTANVAVEVPVGSVVVAGFAPTVAVTENIEIEVPVGVITLAGFVPGVAAGASVEIEIPVGVINLTGFAPTVSISNHIEIETPAGVVDLAGFVPVVSITEHVNIDVPVGAVDLAGFAPVISITEHIDIEVPTGSITVSGYVPSVTVGAGNIDIEVPIGVLILAGYAPTVTTTWIGVETFSGYSIACTFVVAGISRIDTTPLSGKSTIYQTVSRKSKV